MVRRKGEGSITKRKDGLYQASIQVGWKPNGKPDRKYFYATRESDIINKLQRAQEELHKGTLPMAGEKQTVKSFTDAWLEQVIKPNKRPRTYQSYSTTLRLYVIPALGGVKLQKLQPQQVQALLNAKRRDGLGRTVKLIYTVLNAALKQAVRWNLVTRNVMDAIEPPRVVRPQAQAFSLAETQEFLRAIEGHYHQALLTVAILEGLRQGEILALRWGDVDLEVGTIRVRHSLQRIEGKLQLVQPKTSLSRRTFPVARATLLALRAHRVAQLEERLQMGEARQEEGYVFAQMTGKPLEPSGVVKAYKRVLQIAGLPPLRFHDLRHTCATLMLASGEHPRVVMAKLGHSEISMTMNTYSHVMPSMLDGAARNMDRLLGS